MLKMRMAFLCFTTSACIATAACVGSGLDCDQEVQGRAVSPDKRYVAEVVSVQCGATTADAIWVLLAKQGEPIDSGRDRVAVFEGGVVGIDWTHGGLLVTHKGAKAFETKRAVSGVSVVYKATD